MPHTRDKTNHPRKTEKLNRRQAENARNDIKVGLIIRKFNDCVEGLITLTREQINAGGKLLDKAVPALQSIEQTNINPTDGLNEQQLKGMLKELIKADPSILADILESDHILENKSVEVSEAESEKGSHLTPVH